METEWAVTVKNLSKYYKIYSNQKEKIKDLITPRVSGKTFYALKNISFEVKKGEVVGILGLNGSGKSTLSNILGGISLPSEGKVELCGSEALISIGAGLNNQLTGIENIELKGLMLGFSKEKINEIIDEVIEFADIGEFIYQPVKTYSSGMKARLGFAISINIDPDILVIDEALSVGDPTFTQKCIDKMNLFKERGKTIFFVSHAISTVKSFCTKALWLEYGSLKDFGTVEEVLPKYEEFINRYSRMSAEEKKEYRKNSIENQEHLLLQTNTDTGARRIARYKIKSRGKVIKYVTLLDRKRGKVLVLPYNMDISIIAFSFLPCLFREDYFSAFLIAAIAVLTFSLSNYPVASYMGIVFIFSFFINKLYAKRLLGKTFIPFERAKEYVEQDKQYIFDTSRKRKLLKNKIVTIASAAIIILYITGAVLIRIYNFRL